MGKNGPRTAILYFSGTGNSELVARYFLSHLNPLLSGDTNPALIDMETLSKGSICPEDTRSYLSSSGLLIFIFPVYAFDAPPPVYRWIKEKLKAIAASRSAGDPKAAVISIPCDPHHINSAAGRGVSRLLIQYGYKVCMEEQIIMPSNFFIAYPDTLNRRLIEKADDYVRRFSQDLLEGQEHVMKATAPGMIARFLGRIEHLGDNFFGKDLITNEACTLCGRCLSSCPTGNISLKQGKIHFGWKCIMCMRCIYRCPKEAITPRLYRFIPLKKGYTPLHYLSEHEKTADDSNESTAGTEPGNPFPERFRVYLEK